MVYMCGTSMVFNITGLTHNILAHWKGKLASPAYCIGADIN